MAEPVRISAADGYALGATVFGGAGSGPVVIVNGATGVSQRYYGRFAAWLAERGFSVITYDYRGVGESRPFRLRGFEGRLRDWGLEDFEGVLRFAARSLGGRPLALVGHSVGGQLLGFPRSNVLLKVAVTVGAQGGYWGHWPLPDKVVMGAIWHLMPVMTRALGFFPGRLGVGEDLPSGVAMEWARWGRRPGSFTDDGLSTEGFERLKLPVLAFSFADDRYAPKAAVDWLHGLLRAAQLERRHVDPGEAGLGAVRHFGFFRPVFRDTLWEEAARFLERAVA
jgi:predicted alpha/beta hydrolase